MARRHRRQDGDGVSRQTAREGTAAESQARRGRPAEDEPDRDLGFGSVMAAESRLRLLNRDGSFNVVRRSLSHALPLDRRKVSFFPLSWTLVHPIDGASPLHGLTREELLASDAEFLVLLTGIDETFSQTVHARSSYKADEVVWDAAFEDIFEHPTGAEPIAIDVGRLGKVRRLPPQNSTTGGASAPS